jgi:hypothetical protein
MEIAISIPCLDYMASDCAISLMALALYMGQPEIRQTLGDDVRLSLNVHKGSILPHARRKLIEDAIAHDATHAFFVDSDVVVPPDALVRLLLYDVPIVLASYPRRYGGETRVIGRTLEGPDAPRHPLLTPMATAPLGCALISLKVFESLSRPWFGYYFAGKVGAMELPEDRAEDTHFCAIAREAGHTIWLDPQLTREIGHVGAQVIRFDPRNARAAGA